jgi:rubrerythrin
MNIYDYAMQMEKEGELFYRELSEKTNNNELKGVLNLMADEEVQHYEFIKAMKDNADTPNLIDSSLVESAKVVFEKIKQHQGSFNFGASAGDMYRQACKTEDAAYHFYMEKAEEAENPVHKEIFTKLAAEEKQHMEMMENLADFVDEPKQWLENGEWHKW